jgi:hypothetical protein
VVTPPFQGGDTMALHGIGGDGKSGPERAADYNRGCQPPAHKTKNANSPVGAKEKKHGKFIGKNQHPPRVQQQMD